MSKLQAGQLPFLDGLRGYAALWVLISHALKLAGAKIPILNQGDWAVDVFILMSGFLMSFHYHRRKEIEPWEHPQTWRMFWLRRFWRIAPLYYVMLTIAVLLSGYLGQCRLNIAEIFPDSATDMNRYLPGDVVNILMHVSFLFGAFPDFAFATPLPDWSIGLEVQFYACFPFIMLAFQRFSYIWISIAFCLLSWFTLRLIDFPMPSFLPLKLPLFVIGILIATIFVNKSTNRTKGTVIAFVLVISLLSGKDTAHSLFLLAITTLIFGILFWKKQDQVGFFLQRCAGFLGNKLATWLADLSYSVYLVHLLLMLPIAAWLIQFQAFLDLPSWVRGMLSVLLTAIPTYSIAILAFQYIEKPGITAGKHLVRRLEKNRA